MSRRTGDDLRFGDLILPDNPPSRQVENAGFRQRRSYVACALPLCGGLFSPKGESCPHPRPPPPPPPRSPPPPAAAAIAAFSPPRRPTSQSSLPLTLPRMRAGRPRLRGLSGPFLPAEG